MDHYVPKPYIHTRIWNYFTQTSTTHGRKLQDNTESAILGGAGAFEESRKEENKKLDKEYSKLDKQVEEDDAMIDINKMNRAEELE